MLLFPKQTKYNKSFSRKSVKINGKTQDSFASGDFAIIAGNSGRVTSRQIESVRRLLRRHLKKQAKVWTRTFPSLPITKKPDEVRMGKGKGSVKYWVAPIRSGHILFEIKGCKFVPFKLAAGIAKAKLGVNILSSNKCVRWIL